MAKTKETPATYIVKRIPEPRGKPQPEGKPAFKFLDAVYLDDETEPDWVIGIEWTKGTYLNGWVGMWIYRLSNHANQFGAKRLTKVEK